MASAVARSLQQEHWDKEGVTISEVVQQLARLHSVIARSEAGDQEHPHPRSCVMNLVIVAEDQAGAKFASATAQELSKDHPLRSITLLDRTGSGDSKIDAQLTTSSSQALFGRHVQCENIRLSVSGNAGHHVRSLIEPLLAPDVGTYLWWMGSPPFSSNGFLDAVTIADVLVVDSGRFERPFLALLELAQVAGAVGQQLGLADLHWSRLRGWRELLAQFFGPEDRLPYLHGINGVGIDYVGAGRGNRVGAALLAGWLTSSVGWKLRSAAAGSGGVVAAYYEAERKHPVDLAFRSVPNGDLTDGEVAAIRIDAVAGGRTCALKIGRDSEQPGRVSVHVEIGEHHQLDHVVSMHVAGEAELLIQLLTNGRRDPVYLKALDSAGELLRALR